MIRRLVIAAAVTWCAVACLVATAALVAGSRADDDMERAR